MATARFVGGLRVRLVLDACVGYGEVVSSFRSCNLKQTWWPLVTVISFKLWTFI